MEDLSGASDAYLIGRIVNGDQEAVRPLIERYHSALAATLQRAVGAAEVDDVCQETWIRVVRSAHRYDPTRRFSAWLFGIAWNRVRDAWSRRRPVSEFPESAAPGESVEQRAIRRDEARRMRELIAALPQRLSEAILLRFFEEMSEKEMAQRLDVPVGTVKSRIHNGLKRLADALAEETA